MYCITVVVLVAILAVAIGVVLGGFIDSRRRRRESGSRKDGVNITLHRLLVEAIKAETG